MPDNAVEPRNISRCILQLRGYDRIDIGITCVNSQLSRYHNCFIVNIPLDSYHAGNILYFDLNTLFIGTPVAVVVSTMVMVVTAVVVVAVVVTGMIMSVASVVVVMFAVVVVVAMLAAAVSVPGVVVIAVIMAVLCMIVFSMIMTMTAVVVVVAMLMVILRHILLLIGR